MVNDTGKIYLVESAARTWDIRLDRDPLSKLTFSAIFIPKIILFKLFEVTNTFNRGTAVDKLAAEPVDYQSIMDDMEEALEKVNKQRRLWIVAIFLLTSSPGIFNAYHIMVSVFITVDPPHWCRVSQLESANWTRDQIKSISKPE